MNKTTPASLVCLALFRVLGIMAILLPASFSSVSAQETDRPWMNTRLSPDERANLLLQQMTLDEKIQLVHGEGICGLVNIADLLAGDRAKARKVPGALGGDGFVRGIPRLGIPDLNMIGAGVGVTNCGERANGQSTPLPSTLALTSAWDPQLAYDFGAVIGKETRNQGFQVSLGGGVNLALEPRNGRNFEYHGEDPILAGKTVARTLRAIQDQGVIADIKHYAFNFQESGRFSVNAKLDERTMRQTDLLAFEIGVKESDVGTVMCAYNRVNGDYACENSYLLNDVLKKDWGFKGWVMSDWGATHSTAKAALAGLDEQQFTDNFFGDPLKRAVEKGEVPITRLNDMIHRKLRTMFAFGTFDNPPAVKPIDVEAGAAVAQRVAEQGAVLLKNAGSQLPLNASRIGSIAVIGSHADVGVLSGAGSAQVDPVGGNAVPPTRPDASGLPGLFGQMVWDPSSPLKAIRAKAPNARVEYDPGTDFAAAAKLAAASEVAIVFVNQHVSEGRDLPNLSLPDDQDELVSRVGAANPRTIVVLETGNPVLMPWLDRVAAVLEAWYPGARGGEAIANILFGDVNPSGKLPITFPRSEADLPYLVVKQPPPGGTWENPMPFEVDYTQGLKLGYKWYDAENKEPLFPFGHGLSYTSFSYSQIKATSGKEMRVAFRVKNTGARAGTEIAQVYVGLPANANEPPKRLVAWAKVHSRPGKTQRVTLSLDPRLMSIWSVEKDAWELVPGEYRVYVGASSRDIRLASTLRISDSPRAR